MPRRLIDGVSAAFQARALRPIVRGELLLPASLCLLIGLGRLHSRLAHSSLEADDRANARALARIAGDRAYRRTEERAFGNAAHDSTAACLLLRRRRVRERNRINAGRLLCPLVS